MFFQETKTEVIDDAVASSLCPFRDPSFVLSVICKVRLGGILLVCNSLLSQMVDVYVCSFSVSVLVKDACTNVEWVTTSVYGPNQSSNRSVFWAELSSVAGRCNRLWVIGGAIMLLDFRQKRRVSCFCRYEGIFDWIRHHEMIDLPIGGTRYTWTNCHGPIVRMIII